MKYTTKIFLIALIILSLAACTRTVSQMQTPPEEALVSVSEEQIDLNDDLDYAYALDLLDEYDYKKLVINGTSKKETYKLTYEDSAKVINQIKAKFGGSSLFGKQKDESFKSSVADIYQTFNGKELYPSVEEKAAHLLYFVVKNHSFVDGNKRIAASMFLWFLSQNNILYRKDGSKRMADNALVAVTLMIAESKPQEKDVMTTLVVNLINRNN